MEMESSISHEKNVMMVIMMMEMDVMMIVDWNH